MSSHNPLRRLTAPEIAARKGREKIVCLTAYTAPIAELLDPYVDLLLVGDSVGMVLHGLPTTVGVTLEMMVIHGQAVMRGSSRALVVVDLPFGSYERSPQQAHESAVTRSSAASRSSGMSAFVRRRPMWMAASRPRAARPRSASA